MKVKSRDGRRPLKIREMIDWIFSHNELVTIWKDCDARHNVKVWEGEAWRIPPRQQNKNMLLYNQVKRKQKHRRETK